MNEWLIDESVLHAMSRVHTFTAQEWAEFNARVGGEILTVSGESAEIRVQGVLTKAPDISAMLFGGGNTTYSDILRAIEDVEKNDDIDKVVMRVSSPGGSVAGLFDVLDAIRAMSKPIDMVVEDMAASAAYAIVSQGRSITATNESARVGSVGIVVSSYVDPNEITVTSTDAPNKRPNLGTSEGRATLVEELDAMHSLFVNAIAEGRGVAADIVNNTYGRGSTLLASEALKAGMIDAIAPKRAKTINNSRAGGGNSEARMDLQELMAKHPELYATVLELGVKRERDRVTAHLVMGEGAGALAVAVKAIKSGDCLTETLKAEYLMAAVNKGELSAAAADDASVAAGAAGAVATPQPAASKTKVLDLIEARLGMTEVS